MAKRKNSRAANGSGTIRQRPDGRWEARYTVGRNPGTGKQIQKSVYGATQAEVRKKLQQTSVDIDNGTYTEPSRLTVGQWLNIWLNEYTGNIGPLTEVSYRGHVRNHLEPELGSIKLISLSAHTIQTLYNRLMKVKGLSAKSIVNINGVLHRALGQAHELQYLRNNSSDAVKLPRVEKVEINPFDDEATKAFLQAIESHRWEILYRVTLYTGMRRGEAYVKLKLKFTRIIFRHEYPNSTFSKENRFAFRLPKTRQTSKQFLYGHSGKHGLFQLRNLLSLSA